MLASDDGGRARHCVFLNFCFDDFVGEHKQQYFDQIDDYLSANKPEAIEIILHNERTPFHPKVSLTAATVVNEE
jgi:hypothetical protein